MPATCCTQFFQKKGFEAYGEDIENLCIDLFNFFKLSAFRREDSAVIQQKLDLDEVVYLCHVESRWLSLLPAIERLGNQFPALLDYFKKLPDSDKNIAKNDRYKQIMTLLTTSETMVQLCSLESVKPVFDQFLHVFKAEGPLIHVLYPSMLLLLKKMMFRFLKQRVIQKKSLDELLKLDIKNVEIKLKYNELEIGVPARQVLKDVRNSGRQRLCYLGIRSFFHADHCSHAEITET